MSLNILSINPANEEVLKEFDAHSDAELERRLAGAADAFRSYRGMPLAQRGKLVTRLAELLEKQKVEYARTITLEMGKLLRAAIQEIEKCALGCRYYADNAARFLADEVVETKGASNFGSSLFSVEWDFELRGH